MEFNPLSNLTVEYDKLMHLNFSHYRNHYWRSSSTIHRSKIRDICTLCNSLLSECLNSRVIDTNWVSVLNKPLCCRAFPRYTFLEKSLNNSESSITQGSTKDINRKQNPLYFFESQLFHSSSTSWHKVQVQGKKVAESEKWRENF